MLQWKSDRRRWMQSAGLAVSGPALWVLSGCSLSPRSPDTSSRQATLAPPEPSTGPQASALPRASSEPQSGAVPVLAPFSAGPQALGEGRWEPWGRHPSKPRTDYEIIRESSQSVLQARAMSSVSGLKHKVNRPADDFASIRWRWRIDQVLKNADVGDRHSDDAPARLVLAFDGDRAKLSMRELMVAEQFQLFTGQPMPYATLMYVWDTSRAEGEVVQNVHSGRIRKLVVQSGGSQAGRWMRYERDFKADFVKAFGEAPGRLTGVGVMTDSDNTRQKARCLYGDVELVPRKAV